MFDNTNQQTTSKNPSDQAVPGIVYISNDGGNTWQQFDEGIPAHATVSCFLWRPNEILAATISHGIYSVLAGKSRWERVDQTLPENARISAIVSTPGGLILGTSNHGIFFSSDNGRTWVSWAKSITSPVRALLAVDNLIVVGADNGIHLSKDKGSTWSRPFAGIQVNGFSATQGKIYAALMNGAIVSGDRGTTWKYVYQPHTLHDIAVDENGIYAMTLGAGLQISENNGITWNSINNGFGDLRFYTFEVKRKNNALFAAQWHGIYRSGDSGKTWLKITTGLPDSTAFTTLEITSNGLIAGIGLRKSGR